MSDTPTILSINNRLLLVWILFAVTDILKLLYINYPLSTIKSLDITYFSLAKSLI
jgi:hypothetical protein